jgi:hypothetical protein
LKSISKYLKSGSVIKSEKGNNHLNVAKIDPFFERKKMIE